MDLTISTLRAMAASVRNAKSPQMVLQDAVSSLNEALSLLHRDSALFPTASLQNHQATYVRLDAQAQALAVNNSLNEAKALRREAEQFQSKVRQESDSLRIEVLLSSNLQ